MGSTRVYLVRRPLRYGHLVLLGWSMMGLQVRLCYHQNGWIMYLYRRCSRRPFFIVLLR